MPAGLMDAPDGHEPDAEILNDEYSSVVNDVHRAARKRDLPIPVQDVWVYDDEDEPDDKRVVRVTADPPTGLLDDSEVFGFEIVFHEDSEGLFTADGYTLDKMFDRMTEVIWKKATGYDVSTGSE